LILLFIVTNEHSISPEGYKIDEIIEFQVDFDHQSVVPFRSLSSKRKGKIWIRSVLTLKRSCMVEMKTWMILLSNQCLKWSSSIFQLLLKVFRVEEVMVWWRCQHFLDSEECHTKMKIIWEIGKRKSNLNENVESSCQQFNHFINRNSFGFSWFEDLNDFTSLCNSISRMIDSFLYSRRRSLSEKKDGRMKVLNKLEWKNRFECVSQPNRIHHNDIEMITEIENVSKFIKLFSCNLNRCLFGELSNPFIEVIRWHNRSVWKVFNHSLFPFLWWLNQIFEIIKNESESSLEKLNFGNLFNQFIESFFRCAADRPK